MNEPAVITLLTKQDCSRCEQANGEVRRILPNGAAFGHGRLSERKLRRALLT